MLRWSISLVPAFGLVSAALLSGPRRSKKGSVRGDRSRRGPFGRLRVHHGPLARMTRRVRVSAALLSGSDRPTEVQKRVDECDMAERLRKIADLALADRVVF